MEEKINVEELDERIHKEGLQIKKIADEISNVVVGQKYVIERMLIGLLADGHILLEGVPGLAKTLSVNSLANAIQAGFKRIQFTPDLLPADLIGTMIYNPQKSDFNVKKGPVFTNIILADEINRAPAKVQSALLEAMAEKQVTIGDTTYQLPSPFLVMATQNPIEQEGTYALPEAQLDRFMLKLQIVYPGIEDEKIILDRMTSKEKIKTKPVLTLDDIQKAKDLVHEVYIDQKVKDYIVDIVFATRQPEKYGLDNIKPLISIGSSPRATINLTLASKAYAFLQGRSFVIPEDIKTIGMDVLRHRIIITYEAEAESLKSDDIIKQIFSEIPIP
ncbi:MAG: MoxR family ATPase [Endomicrobiaceae bacterium]|jgi:MoxR-like ATPase|nr:MoxR family ATPase [Endomicrobiaceae bacterium]MDD3730255.1 MoxR family ATPase [Endomicrobiaceae bacterium]MDD4166450.1 MoxR family ATPase [Endomicrobiaceae bacterium]